MPLVDAEVQQSGHEGPPAEAVRTGGSRPRRRWWLIALGGLSVVLLAVAGVLAGTYRPVAFGGVAGGSFPGLPAGAGLRLVNGGSNGKLYVPPQRGVFTITESVRNSGPLAVTIEAVTATRPAEPGVRPWPLLTAGQAMYVPEYGPRPKKGHPVAGLSLRPGQAIMVGIPVRMSYACYVPNGWTGVNVFYVKERFLIFTHWVAIPVGSPVVFHEPEPRSSRMVCPGG